MEDLRKCIRGLISYKECGEEMATLDEKDFILDPIYCHLGFHDDPQIRLRKTIIDKLLGAKKILRQTPGCEDWNLKIWDGYRTVATQKILFDSYLEELEEKHPDWDDKQYQISAELFIYPPSHNPISPSPHNTGAAVDLTLVDHTGNEVPMGTEFDEFNEKAFTDFFSKKCQAAYETRYSKQFHKNRMLLKHIMDSVGFVNYPMEWWHFSYGDQLWASISGQDHAIYGSMEL